MNSDTRTGSWDRYPCVNNDENGKYVRPRLIQRGQEYNAVQLERRKAEYAVLPTLTSLVSFDYMGASEFEDGALARRTLELSRNMGKFIMKVADQKVWVYFNPECYDQRGAEYALYLVWNEAVHTKEYTGFNARHFRDYASSPYMKYCFWAEIIGGLFWTTNRKFAERMERAIKGSAAVVLDRRKLEATEKLARQREAHHRLKGEPGTMRERLIAEGKLNPSRS